MRKLKTDELNRLSVEDYKSEDKNPVVVVLDNIRSLNNVGSAFRTSDVFKTEKIYLCGITGKPPHRDIQKTALGATESVIWKHYINSIDAIKELKTEGYKVVIVEQTEKTVMLQDFYSKKNEKIAFVFGNEMFGVSDELLAFADLCLEIPQFGTKHSLNVSVSMGIVLWHWIYKSMI